MYQIVFKSYLKGNLFFAFVPNPENKLVFHLNRLNMKGLIHHTPTDEDISKILKEFTVDFLLKGYGYLVQEIYTILISDIEMVNK